MPMLELALCRDGVLLEAAGRDIVGSLGQKVVGFIMLCFTGCRILGGDSISYRIP